MVQTCCVTKCNNRSHDRSTKQKKNDGVRYFSFPTWKLRQGPRICDLTMRRRMAWVAAVNRPNITFNDITRHMLVCSRHFHTGKPAYEMNEKHPDWAPSLHLGHTEEKPAESDRVQWRKRQEKVTASSVTATPCTPGPEEDVATTLLRLGSELCGATHEATSPEEDTQRNGTVKNEQGVSRKCVNGDEKPLRSQIDRLREENVTLKKERSAVRMDEELFDESDETTRDEKVNCYTGLPYWTLLQALHAVVTPRLTKAGRKLSPFQMLLLTLMRLRLDLPPLHFTYLFQITHTTLSEMFEETINVLHFHLAPLVHFPARHCLQHATPRQFVETFGSRAAVILDCFEIFTEKPLGSMEQVQAGSHKQKNTVKYVVGITPQGSISFISKGWEGQVSDKQLTGQCGILDKLLPGDLVLATRGFDIEEEVGLMCAEVKSPDFTGGPTQMEPKSVEETRQMAHLRDDVERVVGLVRNKYNILQQTIPRSLLVPVEGEEFSFIDKLVTVCCALTNMCPSVVMNHKS